MQKAVLVTGASSGIGRRLTERLADLGHRVYASARRPADLDALGALDGVTPVPLDVRDPEDIRRAVEQVRDGGIGLRGLVNNAGVGGIGPIAAWEDPELDQIFAVNALGPVRVTRAFLPLLLESRGRVVTVGSQGGSISKKHFGPYTMTKHAVEAFTTALDEEVAPFGMRASIVQPGGVLTSIGENSLAGDLARFRRAPAPFDTEARQIALAIDPDSPPDVDDPSAVEHDPLAVEHDPIVVEHDPVDAEHDPTDVDQGRTEIKQEHESANAPESEANRKPAHPDLVVDAILHALFDPFPRRRYLVGTRWEGNRVIDTLLDRLADTNACPELRYSHDELVAWLERKLARD